MHFFRGYLAGLRRFPCGSFKSSSHEIFLIFSSDRHGTILLMRIHIHSDQSHCFKTWSPYETFTTETPQYFKNVRGALFVSQSTTTTGHPHQGQIFLWDFIWLFWGQSFHVTGYSIKSSKVICWLFTMSVKLSSGMPYFLATFSFLMLTQSHHLR